MGWKKGETRAEWEGRKRGVKVVKGGKQKKGVTSEGEGGRGGGGERAFEEYDQRVRSTHPIHPVYLFSPPLVLPAYVSVRSSSTSSSRRGIAS